ncbi:serine/arginine repetitive matrix protein 2 isoform X3 [Schistocerca gregaria]|uniref:serine/arginine repetitive matrix protein 2 isoform X3 n=1 Tax=Schistocerca gregaria TaxID=7010 RepID=UPI00211E030E|nr:serine/arginine repetitive matrix protein 2 isoform X3 [Schistocerca gregaria]
MVVIQIVSPPAPCDAASSAATTTSVSLISSSSASQVEPDGTVATTKEEEWVTKKKTELTTRRQIETRVKRQVVLEGGKVVEDSGPIVTTSTTEDTEKEEHQQTEAYLAAVCSGQDVRLALTEGGDGARGDQLVEAAGAGEGPREVHRSVRAVRVTDTSDVLKQSARQPDGRLVTETRETREREEVRDDEAPDPEHAGGEEEKEVRHESSQRHARLKDEHVVEYLADGVKIGEEMRYVSEEAEGSREGGAAPADLEWDSLSTRVRRMRRAAAPADRKDALTKRPLDFDQEEETRKAETSKWLEHHFGSESRSSKGSLDDEEAAAPATNTSFINVTMKSRPLAGHGRSRSPAQPAPGRGYVATVNSSARVFVSSPEPEEHAPAAPAPAPAAAAAVPPPVSPPSSNGASAGGFFRGVSEWSERRKAAPQPTVVLSTSHGPPQRVQVLPTGPHHTFSPLNVERRAYNGVPERGSPQYNGSVDRVSSPYSGSADRVTSPYGDRDRTRSPSPPVQAQPQRLLVNGHSPALRVASYGSAAERDRDLSIRESPTPPRARDDGYPRRRYQSEEDEAPSDGYREPHRGWERQRRRQREPEAGAELPEAGEARRHPEPPPDYSPPTPSPSPPPEERPGAKKVFQRTRFSADIPPPPQPPPQQTHKRSIGESFRKLVGKFRTSSSERKKQQQQRKGGKQRPGSRSPSPSPFNSNSTGSGSIPGSKAAAAAAAAVDADGWEGGGRPSAPPRASRSAQSRSSSGSGNMMQHQRRFYLGEDPFGGSIYGREREYDGVVPARRKHRQVNGHRRHDEEDDPARYHNGVNGSSLGRFSKSTSRLVTSASSTTPPPSATADYTRSAQTLPRKLYDDHGSGTGSGSGAGGRIKRSLYAQQKSAAANGSTINVSIINHVTPPGPAKPARTYRSSLARSQSFNVHALSSAPASAPAAPAPLGAALNGGLYKSNPQLHRLDESPPPLKSPGILASISRSQRDLTKAADPEPDVDRLHRASNFTDAKFSRSTSNLVSNGGLSPRESKRRVFLQELRARAPELYRTLHASDDVASDLSAEPAPPPPSRPARAAHRPYRNGAAPRAAAAALDYSSSFRSSSTADSPSYRSTDKRTPLVNGSGTTTTVERRRGSGSEDYSETVRITSTVDDPVRPSVINTVQSFTKKTVPLRGGLSTETIESSETTTVTKSRYTPSPRLLDGPSSSHNGGVVIEVRPRK